MTGSDHDNRPAGPPAAEKPGALPPAMPESPIPDWAPRNRTPDPHAPHRAAARPDVPKSRTQRANQAAGPAGRFATH